MLSLRNVSKLFTGTSRQVQALSDISLDIAPGKFLALVGPSGCGKTTLLNLLMGLYQPTTGEIIFNGRAHNNGLRTEIGYITQRDTLLPWRTLQENVELAMEIRCQLSPKERQHKAQDLIEMAGLGGFEGEFPGNLSGGMRQRAQVIRTLAYDPQVILLDEPFASLDAITRGALQAMLLQLWQEKQKTILFVTHDLVEAITLADEVLVMSAAPGKIKAVKSIPLPRPRPVFDIYTQPRFEIVFQELWNELGVELGVNSANELGYCH